MSSRTARIVVGIVVTLLAAGCSTGADGADGAGSADPTGVGVVRYTFVDTTRPTPRSRDLPEEPERTLATTIWYPTTAAPAGQVLEDAAPDLDGGPYPLVVWSHGLGATPELYADAIEQVAAAGFVVVAPTFPRTSLDNPGGADAGDTGSQPGDVSFLVDSMRDGDADGAGIAAGLVDTDRVAAIGHSNGAITTLGATANTCCRDDRIDAAVVIAGTPSPFADGEYDFGGTPATLLVHGTADALVPYEEAGRVFNELTGTKGLLTLDGVDHGSFVVEDSPVFATFTQVVTDFLRAELLDDGDAVSRLEAGTTTPGTELVFVDGDSTGVTVVTEAPRTGRRASADPSTGLSSGQVVTVSWSGFTPGKVVNIVQCSGGGTGGSGVCDLANGRILQPDPTGEGSLPLAVVVGPVGTGTCDATTPDCVIVVNDGGLQDPDATIRIPISFAEAVPGG